MLRMKSKSIDHRAVMEAMELYCKARPRSPSAVRKPQLINKGSLWIALLGPSIEKSIAGFGPTIDAALRAFDVQYLSALRPPIAA